MFGPFRGSSRDEDSILVRRALSPNVVTLISASCCTLGTGELDARAEAAAHAALATARLDWPVLTVTVTQAQHTLPKISTELDAAGAALAAQVRELVMSNGLAAFPVVLVNQRLISYGGAPDHALILKALRATAMAGSEGAAHAHTA